VSSPATGRRFTLLTLGCARNEVDSEELAGRLTERGWAHVADGADADVVLVNTCGFVESAKKDSVDTLLAAADSGARVVAVGCLAERYGAELADSLPEADAVLGFDHYATLDERLADVVAGRRIEAHRPVDRRTLLPITPVRRPAAAELIAVPGHGWGPRVVRARLDDSPVAPLKIASGCDRRCSFCAIPSFRGAFVSRPVDDLLAEAAWLAGQGVRELYLVSENSTSYGKDLPGAGDALAALLPRLATVPGIDRVRVSYLQPAETRPTLVRAMTGTAGVADYFDLSFQHSSESVLRRMRRFGSTGSFLDLIGRIRELSPAAGIRTNVIVGFPGETEDDVAELVRFLTAARLDAVGVFGYSDEDGTEAETLPGKWDADTISERVAMISALVEELTAQRAEDRIGETVDVLVERLADDESDCAGRAAHQAPEVDGECVLADGPVGGPGPVSPAVGPVPQRAVPQRAVPLVNVANILTVSRLVLVPVFLLTLFADGGHQVGWRLVASAVFVVAAVTDHLDGNLARSRGLVTDFGKIADPIADKALTGAALVGLSLLGELPWWVTVVIAAREIGITLLRFWVIRFGVIPASRGGKAKTLVQLIAIGLYLLPLPDWSNPARWIVLGAAVVLTVVTGVDYVFQAVRLRARGRETAGR
jgi:ribosomal protein S12 methylthiotransferase RimO/CDP-diacylglycerol--glycerol-3-phosphate 3-phosphatidyltransferase